MSSRSPPTSNARRQSQLDVFARPLSEIDKAEGNFLELPLVKLSNKEAKPLRDMIDKKTGKEERLPHPDDYKQIIERRTLHHGTERQTLETVTIVASTEYGYLTMFGWEALLAVLNKAARLGWASPRVPITRIELLRAMRREPCGKYFKALDNAMLAASAMIINVDDAWLAPLIRQDGTFERRDNGKPKRRVHPGRRVVRLVKEFSFAGILYTPSTESAPDPAEAAVSLQKIPGATEDFVELGAGLWDSARSGYLILLDLAYLSALPDSAKRLYAYLTKHDYRTDSHRLYFRDAVFRLGLKRTANSQVEAILKFALDALSLSITQDGVDKRFVSHYAFEGQGRERSVLIMFAKRHSSTDILRARLASPAVDQQKLGLSSDEELAQAEWERLREWLDQRIPEETSNEVFAGVAALIQSGQFFLTTETQAAADVIVDRFTLLLEHGVLDLGSGLRYGGVRPKQQQ